MILTTKQISGALAMWAVRQSPYPSPDNLGPAIEHFRAAWAHPPMQKKGWPPSGYFEFADHRELRKAIEETIDKVPEIRAWNERKNGNQAPYKFVDRYSMDSHNPDDDFIDLGALAGNAAMTCMREDEHDRAFDEDFERRWNSLGARWGRLVSRMRQRFA